MIKKYYSILPSEGGKGLGMSKEEIKNSIPIDSKGDLNYTGKEVDECMDRWAKQESIEFAKWAAERFVYAWDDLWLTLDGSKKKHPTEYVWNLYLTSKQEG